MSVHKMTRIALLAAILYVAKVALEFLPNVELVSLLLILYTLVFGKDAFIIVIVFNLFQMIQWGVGTWLISYFYVWPLLCLLTILCKRIFKEEFVLWAIFSGIFGLIFGALFSLVYLVIEGPGSALAYWISGLTYDVVHAAANFILMLVCGKPLYRVLRQLRSRGLG